MCKILTVQMRLKIACSFVCRSKEQNERHKGTRETADSRFIDQYILKKSKARRKNVAKAWIDIKKVTYDMTLQGCQKSNEYSTKSENSSQKSWKTRKYK